jgi:Malectin domain
MNIPYNLDERNVPPMVTFPRRGEQARLPPSTRTTTVFDSRICDYDGLMLLPPSAMDESLPESSSDHRDDDHNADTSSSSPREFSICSSTPTEYFKSSTTNKTGIHHPHGFVDIEIVDETECSESDFDVSGRDPKQKFWYKAIFVLGWVIVVVLMTVLITQLRRSPTPSATRVATNVTSPSLSNNQVPATAPTATDPSFNFVVRINCGATSPYLDLNQRQWIPDTAPGVSNVYSVAGDGQVVVMTHDPQTQPHMRNVGVEGVGLYLDERIFKTVGHYEITVPRNGLYHVDLFFAETYYARQNQRVFDVLLEGIRVEENYDIVQRAGGANYTATRVTHTVSVDDLSLSLFLVSKIEYAKLSGIRVRSLEE